MRSFFPWRLFWKFFWTLFFLSNLLFITSLGIASYIIDFRFYSAEPLIVVLIYAILSALGCAAFSYRFASPLRRVILSALRIANKKQLSESQEMDMEAILEEEPGEYFELEMALNKIRRKLKKRRTQLAHEREETQALMSSLDDAILSVDLQQKIKFFNSRFANQFLDRSQSASLSSGDPMPLAQIFRVPELLQVFRRTLETRETQTQSLKLDSIIDGEKRIFAVKVSPLREERSEDLYGAMALFHDITEIKKAEQIRIEFVENASHELRTPLTSIKGFVDTAKEDLKTGHHEQLGYFLNVISKNVDRLTELVGDMLTLSSLESGAAVKKEALRPNEITQDLIERMASLAAEKQIMIKVTCEVEEMSADIRKVEQVLTNLVGNAIKYIPIGGKIEIRWEEDDQHVILKVVDNGPGIAEMHLKRLFERFYRIDKGRSRDVGGTGLGLSIVKHIMQSHGGCVQVKSETGHGAEFICLFPK
jgi:two-component system, OmpR family, phosphate regulon sensor histidine kinase PhoR